ncbi:MAG TPA: hypothetical protein DDW65_08865 [Firmicutes bacterium]|jgi:hypothetical protein|nr:hypothetical protein [Bacillota bacterium]
MIDFRNNHFNPKQIPVAIKDSQKQTDSKPKSLPSGQIATKKDSIQLALSPEAQQSLRDHEKIGSINSPSRNHQNDKIENSRKESRNSSENSRKTAHIDQGTKSRIAAYQKFLNPPRIGQSVNRRA